MRQILIIILTVALYLNCTAQDDATRYFNRDQLALELYSNQWLNAPQDIELHPISLTFNVQLMYNILGRNRNIALATGVGFMTEHYMIDASPNKINHTLQFTPIDKSTVYSSNKIRFNTFEIPLELRLRTNKNSRNKAWKLYLGAKVGYMCQSMYKYNGDHPEIENEHLKRKTYNVPYTEDISYGVTAKIGYGSFLISGYYALTHRFKVDKAPELFPLMIGITFFVY